MSDEKPRRSWRDLDRQRDKSAHRRNEPGGLGAARQQRSQKSYRASLDRLFDSGKLGQLLNKASSTSDEQPDTSGEQPGRLKLLKAIKNAEGREAVTKALDAYLADHELPEDVDVLAKAIEHRAAAVQITAMQRLLAALDQTMPRRTRGLIGQLKLLRETTDDDQVGPLATQLIDRLEAGSCS